MTRRRTLELVAAAAMVATLAVVAARSFAAEFPAALDQTVAGLAALETETGLFQSPLVAVGGYNGQLGPFHSPLAAVAQSDGQPGGGASSSQAVLYDSYLPWIARNSGDSLSSTIFLQNISGTGPASVTVSFYDEAGAFVHSVGGVIPADGSLTFAQATMAELPDGFEGGAVVESDGSVLAVVNLVPGMRDRLLTYNGIADPNHDVVLPLVTRNASGSTTSFWIQNTGSQTTSVQISYLPYGGGAGCLDTIDQVPPSGLYSLDGGQPPCITDGFYGLASIQADEPVAVVAAMWQLAGSGASAYEGVASPTSPQTPVLPYRQLAPRQEKKSWSNWSSSVLMANVGSGTATMAANWYDGDGSGPATDSRYVPAGQRLEYHLPTLEILPDGFDGSLVVESDQPIALVSNWANPSEPGDGYAMNTGIAGNRTILEPADSVMHLPRLAHGPDSSTQFSIQNAAVLEAMAMVTITYYDQSGTATAVVQDAIPYQGVKRYDTSTVPGLDSEWQGVATILSTQPIAAEVMQFLYTVPPETCPEVSNPADSGPGTLRKCINSASSGDTITFDPAVFPPSSPTMILVKSQLPALSQGNITIDGSNAGVVIDGGNTHTETTTAGLWISSDYNAIRGLQILHFPSEAIRIQNAGQNVIGGDNTVGSGPTGEGNVLSASLKGVHIDGTGAVSNTLLGNLIGLDTTGVTYMGNEYEGVAVHEGADYTIIGGTESGHGNTIAGNVRSGILLESDYNLVAGNQIGPNAAGSQGLPNGTGIRIKSAATQNIVRDNVIGGNNHTGISTTGWGNRIGYNEVYGNAEYGVHVNGTDALTNTITQNSIHHNRRKGIRLEDGGNADLPAPIITSHDVASGYAAGTSCALCTVEVFSDGEDEGAVFEGVTVADGTGTWSLDTGAPFLGPNLTATGTDPDGNTSEFGVTRRYWVHLPMALRNAGSP